jgi:hypothetical protein
MPNPALRRWTADDIAKLKNMAQKHPSSTKSSVAATAVKAHELKLSLRMPGRQRDQVQTRADPGPAGSLRSSKMIGCRRGGYLISRGTGLDRAARRLQLRVHFTGGIFMCPDTLPQSTLSDFTWRSMPTMTTGRQRGPRATKLYGKPVRTV